MKTEARKMAEKMSKSKKEADIAELAREISRGGAKPKGIDPTIPDSYREMLMDREREAMFKKGESNRYAKGGAVKKKMAVGGLPLSVAPQATTNAISAKPARPSIAERRALREEQRLKKPLPVPPKKERTFKGLSNTPKGPTVFDYSSQSPILKPQPIPAAWDQPVPQIPQETLAEMAKTTFAKGGMAKKKYAKGGAAMCGASVPPAQKGKK